MYLFSYNFFSAENYTKIGSGVCRGPGWQDNGFPKHLGRKSVQDCSSSCEKTKGCTAFELSQEDKKSFSCLLFGHKNIVPASSQSLTGACYKLGKTTLDEKNEEELIIDIEGDVDISLLGKGGCRGGGWQSKDWPKVKGFATIDDCGRMCVATKSCSSFHIASQKEGSSTEFECFLFGHKSVIPAVGLPGDCYTVSKGSVRSSKMVNKKSQASNNEPKKKQKIPVFEEPKVVNEVYDEEDEDWLLQPPPTEIRSREHISEILGLQETSKDSDLKVTETTLKDLKKIYETSIKDLEKEYKYRKLSNRHFGDPEMFNKPLIVLMGPWSGGKSTMINYLLGTEFTTNAFRSSKLPNLNIFYLNVSNFSSTTITRV